MLGDPFNVFNFALGVAILYALVHIDTILVKIYDLLVLLPK